MSAYIVNIKTKEIVREYEDSAYAEYAMSENYGWDPEERYEVIRNEIDLEEFLEGESKC